jgi:alpha-tubulin suppressor-like RCC1 family protein
MKCIGVSAVALGDSYTCVILFRGEVKCWGSNEYGKLGVGDTRDRHSPEAVALESGNISS